MSNNINYNNPIPGIECEDEFFNPTLSSPNSSFELPFYQTRDTLLDVEVYKRFLDSAIGRFRKGRTYKHYKGYLIDLGLDKSQVHSNLNMEMCSIELHHHGITIFDIAIIITEHILNTKGYISTFDLVKLLREEHINNRVHLVMLDLTTHQLNHANQDLFVHPDMCFGDWSSFLRLYHTGITQDLAFKILFYLKRAIDEGGTVDNNLLELKNQMEDWSRYNV